MNEATDLTLAQRRELIAGARRAFDGLEGHVWRAGSRELAELLTEVDEVVAAGEAARVVVTREAMDRGEPGSGAATMTPVQWVRAFAPSTRHGGSAQVVALAEAFSVAGNAPVKEAVLSGRLPVRSAVAAVTQANHLRPLLAEGAEPAVVQGLADMAVAEGPRGCRALRGALLAKYGIDGALQREHDGAKRFIALTQPHVDEVGVAEYHLTLDPESRAVLEAALGPLSAPKPVDGEPDLRSSDRRRGEALVGLVRQAVASGGVAPKSTKAQLFVTVDLDTLRHGLTGAGVTVGGADAGSLIAPETVRRLACDAGVIPVVIGGDSEVLDFGRTVRLFTPAQTKRLWLRDGGCTFPRCSMPPQWTDAHHLIHWADGGPTDVGAAALLCDRHHHVVHSRRYAGHVLESEGGPRVEWDLTAGSYDQLLAERAAREPA
jgi:Domain of unknown function (DUF222)